MLIEARNAGAVNAEDVDLRSVRSEVFFAFSMIQLIGASAVQEQASIVLEFIDQVLSGGTPYDDKQWRKVIWGFRVAAREDLGPDVADNDQSEI
jgi:hypothetical protein